MAALEGRILQTPPRFSAKKIDGRPAYRLARAGREVTLEPVEVVVESFRLLEYRPPDAAFEVRCGSGTYIRSLAHDVGAALGCGAHLASLVRTAVGPFRLEDCRSVERLEVLAAEGRSAEFLLPLESLLPESPRVALSAGEARRGPRRPDRLLARARGRAAGAGNLGAPGRRGRPPARPRPRRSRGDGAPAMSRPRA